MEHLNKIELRGILGSFRVSEVHGKKYAQLCIATSHEFSSGDNTIIETTWHSVNAFVGGHISEETLNNLKKGIPVYVCGRIRNNKYVGEDGVERYLADIVASELDILDGPLFYQK